MKKAVKDENVNVKAEGNVKEEKKNNITELVFILDRSGSMGGLEKDTIGGFNSMIERQKKEEGKCFVTTVLFDNVNETLHDRVDLSEIKPMTEKDYYVRGCTALIDAMGDTIHHIMDIHKYVRPEDVPAHTMFVITTDGMENASKKYSSDDVKKLVEAQKKECGWEFLFIGANIDSVETAAHYGIEASRAVNYHADKAGTRVLYAAVGSAVSNLRKKSTIAEDWADEIAADFESRK